MSSEIKLPHIPKEVASYPVSQNAFKLPVINPSEETRVTYLQEADTDTVNRIVDTASRAFVKGIWREKSISERCDILKHAAVLIRDKADEIAALDTLTTGLCFHRSTLRQTRAAADWFDFFADLIRTDSSQKFSNTLFNTDVVRDPVGVCGLFTPWNIPVMGAGLKLSAALAMGNSCVIKPSEQSPLGTLELVDCLYEAGVPRDVLGLVNGRGHITGAALASHPEIARISFTGGEEAGAIIAQEAAGRFAKTTLELGGKSGNIIFQDADYERALDGALLSVYGNNGQACLAGSRILVQKSIADKFIADFVSRVKNIKIGDPFEKATELGPLSSKPHMERVLEYTQIAKDEGGELLTGGTRAEGFETGYYIDPIVTLAKSNSDRVCQEEIFGPFATFLIFDDEDESVSMANDSRFGLAGYVWSQNIKKAQHVAARLRAGTVVINSSFLRERQAPFGGYKASGVNREGGHWSLDFYSEAKTIVTATGENLIPSLGKG